MTPAPVVAYEVEVSIPPLAGLTSTEEAKPESRVEVKHVPVYGITSL